MTGVIRRAVKKGDVYCLRDTLSECGINVDEVDPASRDRFTAVHWACHFGKLECLRWLLWMNTKCCDVRSVQGWTPCHVAAIRCQSGCVQILVRHGASIGLRDCRGNSPAHLAIVHGSAATLRILLDAGYDVNATNVKTRWSLVHSAAFHGRLGCLQLLVKRGAVIDDVDSDGNTPAHLAAAEGHAVCLRFIVDMVTCRYAPACDVTTTWHPVLSARNDLGHVPLTLAEQFYKSTVIEYIQEISVEPASDITLDDERWAHAAAYDGDIDVLTRLLEDGPVDVNRPDKYGSTALHKAAGQGHVKVIEHLLRSGATNDVVDSANETPSDVALRFRRLRAAGMLTNIAADCPKRGESTSTSSCLKADESNVKSVDDVECVKVKSIDTPVHSVDDTSQHSSGLVVDSKQSDLTEDEEDNTDLLEQNLAEAKKLMDKLKREFIDAREHYALLGGKLKSHPLLVKKYVKKPEDNLAAAESNDKKVDKLKEMIEFECWRQMKVEEEIERYRRLILALLNELDQQRDLAQQKLTCKKCKYKTVGRKMRSRPCNTPVDDGVFYRRKAANRNDSYC